MKSTMKEDLIELPRRLRPAEVRASSFDEKANTVELVWTTGATVRRCTWLDGSYDEELVVGPKNVRLERLNAGAPFLNCHGAYDLAGVIGTIVPGTARLEGGQGLASVQLSRREDIAGLVQDIRDGVIRNVSVGYRYHKIEKTEADDGSVPKWRVVDWEPLEISAVAVGADPGAQVRSEQAGKAELFPCVRTLIGTAKAVVTTNHIAVARMRMRMLAAELGLAA